MADKKISQLTTLAQADVAVTADFLPIVDTSATETKKATPQSVVLGALGATSANVGIGTASPGGRLHITTASGNTEFVHNVTGSGTAARTSYQRGGTVQFLAGLGAWSGTDTYQIASSTGPLTTLDSSGNLGIGTASPAEKLEVSGTVAGALATRIVNLSSDSAAVTRISMFTQGGTWNINANRSDFSLAFATGTTERMRLDSNGNIVAGASAALATNATNGFLYVPTCAGTPTGTPTAITGMAPIVVNTTNNKLYFYSGGAWRDAGP